MTRIVRFLGALLLCVVLVGPWPLPAAASPSPLGGQTDGTPGSFSLTSFGVCTPDRPQHQSPAIYRICRPPWWWPNNGDLVIWAHGYVDPTQPVAIPEDQLCLNDQVCIPDLVNFLGYNFITTSYAVNGLAVVPGIQDIVELVSLYAEEFGQPGHVFLVGASEGGLITTLAVEQYPTTFSGGLATCGPIGDFRKQINYFGDVRVVFDYFFPGLIPGSPVDIPPELLPIWHDYYAEQVEPVVFDPANRDELDQLLAVTQVAVDPNNWEATARQSISETLWYDIFSTNNATEVLGGQPFGNLSRTYHGSYDDAALNAGVERVSADPAAIQEIRAHYQTTGVLSIPLVTLHTTLDPQVPYWHEKLYLAKTIASGAWPRYHWNYRPTQGYGHCAFALADALGAFNLLLRKAGAKQLDPGLVERVLQAVGPEGQWVQMGR